MNAIQRSIDKLSLSGGGTHVLPSRSIGLKESAIVRRGVTLRGNGTVGFDHTTPGINGGTIFEVRSSVEPAIILESGASIADIGFDYPMQVAAADQPIATAPTIKLGQAGFGGYDLSITGCTFYKSYCAIDARGSTLSNVPFSNLTISGNRGATLHSFLELDYLADWGSFASNNLNAGRIAPLKLKEGLVRWVAREGAMFRIGGCDWLKLTDNQAWGYGTGVRIEGARGFHGSGLTPSKAISSTPAEQESNWSAILHKRSRSIVTSYIHLTPLRVSAVLPSMPKTVWRSTPLRWLEITLSVRCITFFGWAGAESMVVARESEWPRSSRTTRGPRTVAATA